MTIAERIKNHPGVAELEDRTPDDEGYSIYLRRGWCNTDDRGTHQFNEETLRGVYKMLRDHARLCHGDCCKRVVV